MAPVVAEMVRLDGAAAENGREDGAREGVAYTNIHKIMKNTELERRVPQMRGPRRAWRACEAKKFLTLRILGLGVLEGEAFNSGRQRDIAPAMHDLGWDVIRQLRHGGRGPVFIGIGKTDLDIGVVIGAAGFGPDRCDTGVDRRAHVAQAVPQEAHPPVGAVGGMIDCSAQRGAPQYRGSGRRRVLGAGVQNQR
ncbi:hypothetical protein Emag_007906 [Eimeria magna]